MTLRSRPGTRHSLLACVAALALLLLASLAPPAGAHSSARRAHCSGSPRTHHRHGAFPCTRSPRKGARPGRHAPPRHRSPLNHGGGLSRAAQGIAGAPSQGPRCEDGTAAARSADGSVVCRDGSEPSCPGGVSPGSSGSAPVCPPVAESADSPECEAGAEEECTAAWGRPGCEDGTAARRTSGGYFACDDDSEPSCEEDLTPSFNTRGLVIACEVPSSGGGDGDAGD